MHFLIDIAITLALSKLASELFERLKLPSLLGGVLVGFFLVGVFGIVDIQNIEMFGTIGLILLLFLAGYEEVKIEALLKHKWPAMINGITGTFFPFIFSYIVMQYLGYSLMESIFVALAMSETSITISIASFAESGKLNSKLGRMILGGGIFDDMVGLFALAFLSTYVATGSLLGFSQLTGILLGIGAFVLIFLVGGYVLDFLMAKARLMRAVQAQFSFTFVIIILLAFLAESIGFSMVIGAFLAGIIMSRVSSIGTRSLSKKMDIVGDGVFIPLFFAWIGMQLVFVPEALGLTLFLLIGAIIIGQLLAGFAAGKPFGLSNGECLGFGFAMIPRGEIALIILVIGKQFGVITDPTLFSTILGVIFITMMITPLLLKYLVKKKMI